MKKAAAASSNTNAMTKSAASAVTKKKTAVTKKKATAALSAAHADSSYDDFEKQPRAKGEKKSKKKMKTDAKDQLGLAQAFATEPSDVAVAAAKPKPSTAAVVAASANYPTIDDNHGVDIRSFFGKTNAQVLLDACLLQSQVQLSSYTFCVYVT